MKALVRLLALLYVIGINLLACHNGEATSREKKYSTDKGATHMTQTYYMGRFALDVPVEMKQAVQAQSIRYAEIKEFEWPQGITREEARQNVWTSRMAELNQLEKPHKIKNLTIEERNFPELGKWSQGVLYYGDYIIPERHFWTVLVDYGKFGVWLTLAGANDDMSLKNFNNILKHYDHEKVAPNKAFHLRYGAINLPYLEQEKTYARFEGHPLDIKLEVEMNETYEVERLGVAERLAASIAVRFAPGVDVDQIRSRSRTAAGLKGEELVMRMSASGEDTQIQFAWEYRGKVDSGEHPEIQITMESPDGDLKEKLKVWDAILDSFKPMYR